ncbi:Uncharacterised protein [Shigella sonnei]|nr:Uncharacterised protein [Shigella sonnei]
MTKQLRLQQLLGQCATVNSNKWFAVARAGVVDSLGENLFPGAALTVNQNADV